MRYLAGSIHSHKRSIKVIRIFFIFAFHVCVVDVVLIIEWPVILRRPFLSTVEKRVNLCTFLCTSFMDFFALKSKLLLRYYETLSHSFLFDFFSFGTESSLCLALSQPDTVAGWPDALPLQPSSAFGCSPHSWVSCQFHSRCTVPTSHCRWSRTRMAKSFQRVHLTSRQHTPSCRAVLAFMFHV